MNVEDSNRVYEGTVIFFSNKTNYGFVLWEKDGLQQPDLFLHYSDLIVDGFKTVKKGQKVQFKLGLNVRGQPKAIEVLPVA